MSLPELNGDEMRFATTQPIASFEKEFQLPTSKAEIARLRGRLWHFATKNNKKVSTSIKGGTLWVKVSDK